MGVENQNLNKDTVKATEVGIEAAVSAIIVRTNEQGEEEFFIARRNNPNEAGYGCYAFLGCSVTPQVSFEYELLHMIYDQTGEVIQVNNETKVYPQNMFECLSSPIKHYMHHGFVVKWEGDLQIKDDSKYTDGKWVKASEMEKYLHEGFITLIAHYLNYSNGVKHDERVNYNYADYSGSLCAQFLHYREQKYDYTDQNLAAGAPRTDKQGFTVAVNAILVRQGEEEEEYCFDYRIAPEKAGYQMYALFGGTLTFGKGMKQELAREMKEELNIDVDTKNMELDNLFRCAPKPTRDFIHYAFLIRDWKGEMQNMEPTKSGGPHWFKKSELETLKDKFFITWGHLVNMQNDDFYSNEFNIMCNPINLTAEIEKLEALNKSKQ